MHVKRFRKGHITLEAFNKVSASDTADILQGRIKLKFSNF